MASHGVQVECFGGHTAWGEEGVKVIQFILGRWVEAAGMCLREGDNVATGNPRSSAESLRASISRPQLQTGRTELSLCEVTL